MKHQTRLDDAKQAAQIEDSPYEVLNAMRTALYGDGAGGWATPDGCEPTPLPVETENHAPVTASESDPPTSPPDPPKTPNP